MKVSPSGYYAWSGRKESPRKRQEEELLGKIQAAHKKSKGTYGSPRIFQELRAEGHRISRKRIARIMRLHGITARPMRRYQVTTDSKHDHPVAENLLDQNFQAERPNARWAGDITYLWTREGWLYLAVMLDLWSRRVIGWSMHQTLDRSLVLGALQAALAKRRTGVRDELLCHSDRGSQYASTDYQTTLKQHGITCSMSRKGNCYDNAAVESFFASLKRELVHRSEFPTRRDARTAVFAWIESWYNRERRHSALGYLSPEQFERQHHSLMAA